MNGRTGTSPDKEIPPAPLLHLSNREVQEQIQAVDTGDDTQHRVLIEELKALPHKNALVEVLKEISSQTPCLPLPSFEGESQMMRLDSMLAAEGLTHSDSPLPFPNIGDTPSEQREYQEKVIILRKLYFEEMAAYEKACQEFKEPVMSLLEQQSTLRPVSDMEKELLLASIQQRFQGIQLQLKECMCQATMLLRTRFLDARRKRRNFSKVATVILNEYFYNNLSHPYPSDAVKEELAAKCNLTVAQVTNWFGNKRIRYKKTFGKSEEDFKAEQNMEAVENMQSVISPPGNCMDQS